MVLVAMFADTFMGRIWTNGVTSSYRSPCSASHLSVPALSSVACAGTALVAFERRDL
jgi:hypothetical protein